MFKSASQVSSIWVLIFLFQGNMWMPKYFWWGSVGERGREAEMESGSTVKASLNFPFSPILSLLPLLPFLLPISPSPLSPGRAQPWYMCVGFGYKSGAQPGNQSKEINEAASINHNVPQTGRPFFTLTDQGLAFLAYFMLTLNSPR